MCMNVATEKNFNVCSSNQARVSNKKKRQKRDDINSEEHGSVCLPLDLLGASTKKIFLKEACERGCLHLCNQK